MFSYKNVGRPLTVTVPNKTPQQKDLNMKLFYICAAVLALAIADEIEETADSEVAAATTFEFLKEPKESLELAASAYNYSPSNTNAQANSIPTQNRWTDTQNPSKYYAPTNQVAANTNYYPTNTNYYPSNNNYYPPNNNNYPTNNNYYPSNTNYVPPSNNYNPPSNNYNTPSNNNPPNNNYAPSNTWAPPAYYPSSSTTTPVPIIKNEITYGDNGSYKYEYEIGDGTHVAEEGYFTNPKTEDESIVKKGWYSYPGPDGKVYTVTYWADHTGFHATGDHLPTPPPIPPAIQAALDQNAKEEAAKAEAEKNKPTQSYYPAPTEAPSYYPPANNYYPPSNNYYPSQPTYYPSQTQQTYYPQQQQSSYGK